MSRAENSAEWIAEDSPSRYNSGALGTLMTTCVECDAGIDVDEFDVDRGDQLSCPECGTNLVVVSLSPVELDLVSDDDDGSEDASAGGPDPEEDDE